MIFFPDLNELIRLELWGEFAGVDQTSDGRRLRIRGEFDMWGREIGSLLLIVAAYQGTRFYTVYVVPKHESQD